VNRHFQAKHAKYSNFCIIKTTAAIKILHSDKDYQILFVGGPKIRSTNPKWRPAGRHLEKNKLLYLSNGSTNFDDILHADVHWLYELQNAVQIIKF